MKTKKQFTYSICAVVAAMLFIPFSAKADSRADLIRLSHSLEEIVDELSHEFSAHYRNSHSYSHLISDLKKIKSEASHIHSLAHNHNVSVHHLEEDMEELDELSHHLHKLVDQIEKNAGTYVFRLFGDTRHVHSELSKMTNNIHSMERAVDRMERERNAHHNHGNNNQFSNQHNQNNSGLIQQNRIIQQNGLFQQNRQIQHSGHSQHSQQNNQPVVRPPSPVDLHNRSKAALFGRRR